MKKLTLFIMLFVIGSSSSFGQVTLPEHFFHELKGLEDSSGVTHLFYREYEKSSGQCSEENGGQTIQDMKNNVFHFNVQAGTDSLKLTDYYYDWCVDGMFSSEHIVSYAIYKNDPEKWVIIGQFEYSRSVSDHLGNELNFQIPIIVKAIDQNAPHSYRPEEILLSPNNDSLYVIMSSGSSLAFSGDGSTWPEFESYEDFQAYADSTALSLEILGIHPAIDSLYFGLNQNGGLYRSEHYSQDFVVSDTTHQFQNLYFDADTTHIYAVQASGLLRSDDLGKQNSWTFLELNLTKQSPVFFALDDSLTGHLFVSDSTEVLHSTNHGDTFAQLHSFETEITGLYKKPDSDILYVLTKEELFELNIATKETTSLKKLPVSVENEPTFTPQEVKLEQNYPNPFNPATVIRYQLAGNSLVRLEVFDITGRKVAVLVDGKKQQVGTYQVTFNADALSSGVYFYRLQAGGETVTLRMTLMK